MGNIRPSFIKIRAIRLWKNTVRNLPMISTTTSTWCLNWTDVSSKKLRNWIAGYVYRYRQRRTD